MCVIMSSADGSKPSMKWLKKAEKANPDGIGVAWVGDGGACFEKDITVEHAHEMLLEISTPYAIHFRMASIGEKSPELCHPMMVDNQADTALAGIAPMVLVHNGHWSGWNEMCIKLLMARPGLRLPDGEMNDTRALAWLTHHLGDEFLDLITGQKVITITGAGLSYHGSGWTLKEGIWLSNDYFLDDFRPGKVCGLALQSNDEYYFGKEHLEGGKDYLDGQGYRHYD